MERRQVLPRAGHQGGEPFHQDQLTYFIYWLDKRRAMKGGRRVGERELLLWALAGGTPAAVLCMRRHRHKTKKTR